MSGKTKEEVAAECASMRWGDFKPILADATIAHLEPIQVQSRSSTDTRLSRSVCDMNYLLYSDAYF